jgi:uncharacterized protein YhdP
MTDNFGFGRRFFGSVDEKSASKHEGAKVVSSAISDSFPEIQVQFDSANFRLGWDGVVIRAQNLRLNSNDGSVYAPQADFWLGKDSFTVVLDKPDMIISRSETEHITPPLPVVGTRWTALGRNATIRWQDTINDIHLTLVDTALELHYANDELQINAEENSSRHVQLSVHLQSLSRVRGSVHASVDDWSALADWPVQWSAANITLDAILNNGSVQLTVIGDIKQLQHTLVASEQVRWRASTQWPQETMLVTLNIFANTLAVAALPAIPVFSASTQGVLHYHAASSVWHWENGELDATNNHDTTLRATLNLSGQGDYVGSMRVNGDIAGLPVTAAQHYVPAIEVKDWLSWAVSGGTVRHARFSIRGNPARFPFADSGGEFLLSAAIDGGRLLPDDDWPVAQELNFMLVMNNDDIVINGKGRIAGLEMDVVEARLPNMVAQKATLYLDVLAIPERLARYIDAANDFPPVREPVREALQDLSIDGEGQLSLAVVVPLAVPENATAVAKLVVRKGRLHKADLPPMEQAIGTVHIDASGAKGYLFGTLLGHIMTLDFYNDTVTIYSVIDAHAALSIVGVEEIPVNGSVPFILHQNAQVTVFTSFLEGASIDLPAPLKKRAQEVATLEVTFASNTTQARLQLRNNTVQMAFVDGIDIAINTPQLSPPNGGINVRGAIAEVDVEEWLKLSGGQSTSLAVSITLHDTELVGIRQNSIIIYSPFAENDHRHVEIIADNLAGDVIYSDNYFRADMSRLSLSSDGENTFNVDLRDMTVSIVVQELMVNNIFLGHLRIDGTPVDDGSWHLNTLNIVNGPATLEITGQYDHNKTQMALTLNTDDAVHLLSIFSFVDIISEGAVDLQGIFNWPGSPLNFSLANLRGRLRLRGRDLRYLKSETSVISLLAVLSPQSLLSLGFVELGKDGVALDIMDGEIVLEDGQANVTGLSMENEDISIDMVGGIGLVDKTLNLRGRVRPGAQLLKASSLVSIGAGIATVQPLSLAAGWLLGKVFEKPLSEIGAYNYTIIGSWNDPLYEESGVTFRQQEDAQ